LRELSYEGAQSSFLEVRASNVVAQEMYRKFGYEESGVRPRYYRDNDEDAFLMTLEALDVERLEDQAA
jgi:ribosomal-protein-alanine N-acetyltransferase